MVLKKISKITALSKKKKYYVVWQGVEPGIYDSWDKCLLQIKGYPAAKYKAFKTKESAEEAFNGDYTAYINKEKKQTAIKNTSHTDIITDSIAVDAACSGNPGVMEYRGVHTSDGSEIFRQGPFQYGTNNIGEFLALVHALALLQKLGLPHKSIYTDSKTAQAWVRNKKVKTSLKKNNANKIIFELVDRALSWLENNTYDNPILKWNTEEWGEIPADFGRK